MAPRRHNSTSGGGGGGGPASTNSVLSNGYNTNSLDVHNLLGMNDHHPAASSSDMLDTNHNHTTKTNFTRCCVPIGDGFKSRCVDFGLINLDELRECIRVICNNENCTAGQYMHRECFDTWEDGVLTYLKSNGRARSWSERQCHQNLWTKKGYDLVFKVCVCKCGRGHLKKDLDWSPPLTSNMFGGLDEDSSKKRKKRNRNNQKPTLTINGIGNMVAATNGISTSNNNITSTPTSNNNNYQQTTPPGQLGSNGVLVNTVMSPYDLRTRTGSLSSSHGSSSPPASGSSEHSISPVHSGDSKKHQKSRVEAYSERVRTTSGCNGIFSRRLDFSTFNMLPKTRLNSYQIKMEDEGNHGNDETRLFILSSLAQHQKSRVSCILCDEPMLVFDRYPLVDGTFFLSPKQHAKGCIEVKYDGRNQFLTAVCMSCLEGVSPDRVVCCRFCTEKWDGSSLVIGTMYAYDIFAAMPCCTERLKCNNCFKLFLHPLQRLNNFSDYSHINTCIHCNTQDTHFVKPLAYCYTKLSLQAFQQWP